MRASIIIISLLFSLVTLRSTGQQLIVDIGRVSSLMDYTDSKGEQNLLLYSDSDFSYGLGFRKSFSDRIHGHASLSFNRYRSFGTDINEVHEFAWDMNFLGLEVGADAELLKFNAFAVFLRAAAGPQMLISGRQTINTEIRPLRGVEQFDTPYLFLRPGIGFNYCATSELALSLRYQHGFGSALKKSVDGEELTFQTGAVMVGLLWSFKNCTYCRSKRY